MSTKTGPASGWRLVSDASRAYAKYKEELSELVNTCKKDGDRACTKTFFQKFLEMGIRDTDPRMGRIVSSLRSLSPTGSLENLHVDIEAFEKILLENIVFVTKAAENSMIIPDFPRFCDSIEAIYNKLLPLDDGELYDMTDDQFGISVCTTDGQRFSIGDVSDFFTLESLSKVITYAITVHELLVEEVHKYQGKEPSGRQYDCIVLDHNSKPFNPYINSGGLLSASLILQLVKPELTDLARKFDSVLHVFERLVGYESVQFNNSSFLAKKSHLDRDYSMGYFLRENHCFPPGANIPSIVDFFYEASSLEMTCDSAAVMAASFANGGICPITDERVLDTTSVNHALTLMTSCGLSISSGSFAFDIGMPAMGSRRGATMLVVPGVMGISIWSPKLNSIKNSVRGLKFCEELSRLYRFHVYDCFGSLNESKVDLLRKTKPQLSEEKGVQIFLAAALGDITFLRRAFMSEYDFSMRNYDGRTPLHLAAAEGHLDCVKFLVNICNVEISPEDRWGNTPYSEALAHKKIDVANYIKKQKCRKPIE